jgi:hypothetical protein
VAVITAPPRVLSMEEYRATWQPEGWQLIIIGPTSTWRQEWGIWEAIRDIVQNALDETEAYRWYYDDAWGLKSLHIEDSGKGVAVADFLLGPPRPKPDYARGKFGEGMKIACLALLRQGFPVYIRTVGRDMWIVFIEQRVDGIAETLAAMWRPNGTGIGTRFHIIGYHGSAFEDRFAINLPESAIVAEGPSLLARPIRRYNQLIRYSFPGEEKEFREAVEAVGSTFAGQARIFARDIYMRDINSLYSYNLWGFDMAPDRHAPKRDSGLWEDMGRLWCCVKDEKLLADLIRMVMEPAVIRSEEGPRIQINEWIGREPVSGKSYIDFIKENAQTWQRAWSNVTGANAVVRTDSSYDAMVTHLGYKSVGVQWAVRTGLSRAIITDKDLIKASQERLSEVEIIPDERLSRAQVAHLKLARAIADATFAHHRVEGGVFAAIIPPASDRVRTAGMYARESERVYISADQLSSGRATVDTVIHELAHHMSGAEDGTEAHNSAMTRVAAMVVQSTAEGKFNEILKDVSWYG